VDQVNLFTLPAETQFTKPLNEMSWEELITLLHDSSSPPTKESPPSALPKRKAANLLTCMDEKDIVDLIHHPYSSLPLVHPCDTPNPLDKKLHWTAEELHCITGCRRFCNYKHLILATTDGQYIDNGGIPVSLGTYTIIPKAPQGKPIDRTPSKYLYIVHIDITFGDCMSIGGFKYALIFVDRATCFNWGFGLKSLHHDKIISAFLAFRSKTGCLATQFWCDCGKKLFGSHINLFLHMEHSSIVSSLAGRQSANGLVESHWKIMFHMSRVYLTKKKMPRTYWYFAIKHLAQMMKMIPGKYHNKLAPPCMLVHGKRPDATTWLPLFLLCYFHYDKDSDASCSKHKAHTMDGIVVGRSSTSNAILVYNPCNQNYYELDSYRFDPYHLPSSVYPNIVYNGGLFVSLQRDASPQISKPYPPGTRVVDFDPTTNTTGSGKVMDIPMDPSTSPQYLIQFASGATTSVTASKMPSVIPKPDINLSNTSHLLPPFLRPNSKITYEHEGQYHKGYLTQSDNGSYYFSYKSHTKKKHANWSIPLPNLTSTWHDLCVNRILLPGHVASLFIQESLAHFVSAANLVQEYPCSLLTALSDLHLDCDVWLRSFREEKSGIESMDTYDKINLAQYRALWEKGAPRAIPTMCALTIKPDEMLNPHQAKSRIVVLGNHEDCLWSKSDKYAPVLHPNTLCLIVSMAIEQWKVLQQGDCKNLFCWGIFPPEEITIVKPPIGDPNGKSDKYWLLKRTLYGFRRSPRHWYKKIKSVLQWIGLHQNAYKPCLFTGNIINPDNPSDVTLFTPLTLGIYMDDFVYFSTNPAVKAKFQQLLKKYVTVDFMGAMEWLLGMHFQWMVTPDKVKVHLSQTGIALHLVEDNSIHLRNITPDATPYRAGLPIDACLESDKDKKFPMLIKCKQKYQSIMGSIGWLAQTTRPDLAPSHSFLSAYSNKPSHSHLNAALYVLHYIHSTIDYSFTFSSKATVPLHTNMLFPYHYDTEAYEDAVPPKPGNHHRLTTYSNACWGLQIGNAIQAGIQLPLFKF
jgi:hypothetical protein